MRTIFILIAGVLCSLHLHAHTFARKTFECPIEGTRFEAAQDMSGTSMGSRLDLKKRGPIAQPWSLAQCPKCGFVLYQDKFTAAEIARLKPIVLSESFTKATKVNSRINKKH